MSSTRRVIDSSDRRARRSCRSVRRLRTSGHLVQFVPYGARVSSRLHTLDLRPIRPRDALTISIGGLLLYGGGGH